MDDVSWYPLAEDCHIRVTDWHVDLVDIETQVNQIWAYERGSNPHLFNGKVFTMLSWSPHEVVGAFCEYKYFVAATRDPEIRQALQLRPLGVSGILRSGNSLLVGRRAMNLFSRPGLYELCPSGSIDPAALREERIDLRRQLEIELEEETRIPFTDVLSSHVKGLAYTSSDGIWDLVIECELDSSYALKSIAPTQEYSEFFWHQTGQKLTKGNVVPLSFFYFMLS